MTRPDPTPDAPRDALTVQGTVIEVLPHAMYAVELARGQRIRCRIAGTLGMRAVRIVPGDRVTVELSPFDLTRGSISRRHP